MNLLSRFGGRIWDPWREMAQLQTEVNRMLSGSRGWSGLSREYPPVNLYVNEHELLLTLEVPGIDPSKVDVTVTGNGVTVTGGRPAEAAKSGENVHRRERPAGDFRRTVQLPFEVDPARTKATYEMGVLKISLARPESHVPRKVSVTPA